MNFFKKEIEKKGGQKKQIHHDEVKKKKNEYVELGVSMFDQTCEHDINPTRVFSG